MRLYIIGKQSPVDTFMPAGHEFCTELRKTVPDAVVPVIMVSAKNDEANIVEGLSHGCNDFVRYPLRFSNTSLHAVLIPKQACQVPTKVQQHIIACCADTETSMSGIHYGSATHHCMLC